MGCSLSKLIIPSLIEEYKVMKLSNKYALICFLTILFASSGSIAQKALVILNDSTQKEIQIKAFSIKTLFTESGNIQIDSIASIAFRAKSVADAKLYKALEDSKVSISYDYVNQSQNQYFSSKRILSTYSK